MLNTLLLRKKASVSLRITAKMIVSLLVVASAVTLPQIVHLFYGAGGGVQLLPMYFPVLIGGCLLGRKWACGVGLLSPLVSFLLTSLTGTAMPSAVRLPYMALELCVFALTCACFSGLVVKRAWMALPAVLAAQILGRGTFLASVAIFQNEMLTFSMAAAQVRAGIPGLVLQIIFAPLIIVALRKCMLGRDEQ